MRAPIALLLALFSAGAWAQVAGLTGAELDDRQAITDPAAADRLADGDWVAFRTPVLEGARSPCCWRGRWDHTVSREIGCSLLESRQSYGTTSDAPTMDYLLVLFRSVAGEIQDLRAFGEHCPVEGGGERVVWIGDVGDREALDWLENAARAHPGETVGESALYALALNRSGEATERLFGLAEQSAGEPAEQAAFWLGEARGAEGLERLLDLLDIASANADRELQEHVVFAISLVPEGKGAETLLDLARDDGQPRAVRRQALFWLAHSDDEGAVAALAELLTD